MADPRAPLLAVLIDADNISPKWAEAIFDEIALLGEASVRRIYGDFSGVKLKNWAEQMASLAIVPFQQFAYTIGKNSSDIALVIDAMDLLHTDRFDGFCLVSSDSDFTRLASRIREQGLDVYGFGQRKTPEAFRNACKRFIYVENLLAATDAPDVEAVDPKALKKEPPGKSIPLIMGAFSGLADESGWCTLSVLGQKINASNPDFDPRNYGRAKLGELLEATGEFEVDRTVRPARARIKPKPGKAKVKKSRKP
jgi:uncharacterized LabA/DUF88 family protein